MVRRTAFLVALLFACTRQSPHESAVSVDTHASASQTSTSRAPSRPRPSDTDAAASVARELGTKLKLVSLLAPKGTVEQAMRQHYAAYVTPALLQRWIDSPESAPGRAVSSPWPERLDVRKVTPERDGRVALEADVVEVTNDERTTEHRVPVRLEMEKTSDGWRVAEWQLRDSTAGDAEDVIRSYYDAINRRDYDRAYRLWSGEGSASNQTYDAFVRGFADTASVEVELGAHGEIGAAAGSRYVDIPVVVTARNAGGSMEQFRGTYTLRRSVVDGATAEQRQWRIASARLSRVRGQ